MWLLLTVRNVSGYKQARYGFKSAKAKTSLEIAVR
jgi:hypothetical protein